MQSTALIHRPADAPKIHVLEVDGPRQKYCQRGEGDYRLSTDNQPLIDILVENMEFAGHDIHDPRLTDNWNSYWEIHQQHDGSIEVHACRPTEAEVMEGDLHGEFGSVIKITWPCRPFLRNALRLARRLCKADPIYGCIMAEKDLIGIVIIESNLPVYRWRDASNAPILYKSA